jgi:hypothetical protein
MNHLKASNRDREVWENRRPGNRPEQRAPHREQGRAHDGPRARSPERNRPLNPAPVRPPPPPARSPVEENAQGEAFNGRCPRCLQRGHRVRDCPNPSAVPRHDCCGWYGRHFPGCANASAQDRERAPNAVRPQGVVNVATGFEPILPHSVEVQPDWSDSTLHPHMEGSFKSALVIEPDQSRTLKGSCARGDRVQESPERVRDPKAKCCEQGHLARDCPIRVGAQRKDCCGGYGNHVMACERRLAQGTERAAKDVRLQGKVNVVLGFEPLLPHSIEVQHKWTDAELYPHSSFTFKPAQPLPVKPRAKRKERSKDAESESQEDDEYSSSEDEGEVFIRGALNKKKRGAPKEYLPKHREPVLNPLSVEERVKRKETRVLNREASGQRNLAMIKAIMGEVMEKLATHRHIKHFRTDLHKYIDSGFNHVNDVPETMNAARLEIVQDEQLVPVLPDSAARVPESARPTFVSGANRVPLNPSQPAGVTNIKLDVDPKLDKTNYQTEVMIEIEQKPFRIIADSGATLSGINLSVVKESNLLPNMKPTEYTYRTSSGKVERLWERLRCLCALVQLWLKQTWWLCRLGAATTCCWATS